ncbi:MAG: hypothetical protein OJF51_002261 [Nitrospira sp.]|nr:MAG: hypothetical protein OJF51_002261 [Nitrospira sp.]
MSQLFSRARDSELSPVSRYAIAIFCATGSVLLRWAMDPFVGEYLPLATIYGFVAAACWYGGIGPAILTTILSYFAAHWLFIEPRYQFLFSTPEYWGAGMYVFSCLVLIALGDGMRRAHFRALEHAALATERERSLKDAQAKLQILATELEGQVEQRTTELAESRQRLRNLANEVQVYEEQERKRLASELHDYLAQTLALGRMKISQLRPSLGSLRPEVSAGIAQLDNLFKDAIQFTRSLMDELSPRVLHDFGLEEALTWLREDMQRHGLTVDMRIAQEPSLPSDEALFVFRSVRELLMNVIKHAKTDRAIVNVWADESSFYTEVHDEGCGFDPETIKTASAEVSYGLFSVRERILAMGGCLQLKSEVGTGSTITLTFPLSPNRSNGHQHVAVKAPVS